MFPSERLTYTKAVDTDREDFIGWYTNDRVMHHITGKPLSLQEAELKFKKILEVNDTAPETGFYTVRIQADQTFAGIAKFIYLDTFNAEAGYGLLPQFWGMGYASEILCRLVEHARQFPAITEVTGIINPINLASRKVLLKQNFSWHHTSREAGGMYEYYRLVL